MKWPTAHHHAQLRQLLSDKLGADSSVQRDLSIIGDEIERVARIVRALPPPKKPRHRRPPRA